MEKRVTVYSYAKVWRVEKKVYVIGNIILPAPVNPYDALAFAGVFGGVMILERFLPFLSAVPFAIKNLGFPILCTYYFRKQKLDGKNPIKYFGSYIVYLLTVKGAFLQSFGQHREKKESLRLDWSCSMGR